MKKVFKLYIDELGTSHPKNYSDSAYYILLGCIIDQQFQPDLLALADHIKFKYWGRTNVIFHSTDMGRDLKDYEIFKGKPELKAEFTKDILMLLQTAPVAITAAVVDKEKASVAAWNEQTVIKLTAEKVLFNFLAYLYTKLPARGKIYIEASSGHRDVEYLKAFNSLLGTQLGKTDREFADVREYLTSLNFVTKQNHDIESQISDLLAYGIRCSVAGKNEPGSYEAKLVKIVYQKIIKVSSNVGSDKKKYYDQIEAISRLPKA